MSADHESQAYVFDQAVTVVQRIVARHDRHVGEPWILPQNATKRRSSENLSQTRIA